MSVTEPLISVVVPTYNYADYVTQAVDSILSQSYGNREVIVVDDGSKDNTRAVLAEYGEKIKYVYQENRGLPAARNTGIRHASGEYVAFLDADDLWLPDKLGEQVALFAQVPQSVGVVSTLADRVMDGQRIPSKVRYKGRTVVHGERFRRRLLIHNAVEGSSSSVLIRRACFDRVGVFDESLKSAEDWDMWLRISKHYDFAVVNVALVLLRVHQSNMSKNLDRMMYFHKYVLEKNLPDDLTGLRRLIVKRKSHSAMLFSNGTELQGNADAIERRLILKSIFLYPVPTFYPRRYPALFRTIIGSDRYLRLRGKQRRRNDSGESKEE